MAGAIAVVSGVCSIAAYLSGPAAGYGSCNLTAPTVANVNRINTYLKQGLSYVSRGDMDAAQGQFRNVLRIDPNFLGANADLGSAYLMQGDYPKAEESFERELQSVDCLNSIPSWRMSNFAYMLDSAQAGLTHVSRTVADYKARLRAAEDVVHYDLACLRLKQNHIEEARQELERSAKNGTIPRRTFENDPDLIPLHDSAEFRAAVSHAPSGDR